MRAILHIGSEKTGTTSVQMFMHQNRAALLKQNVLYPSGLGGVNHRWIATYGLDIETGDESVAGLGFKTQAEMDIFYGTIETQLANQISENAAATTCIVSSEHLHSRLKTTKQITRVKNLLTPLFDEIEVHVHLRPQVDVALSLASTQSRVGGRVGRNFFERMKADQIYYNYNLLVSHWEDAFGAENVVCIPFKSRPDYFEFLAERIGIDRDELPKPQRVNEAFDVRTMAMVNAITDSGTGQLIDFRVLDALPVEQKLALDIATARRIQARFEESNRALIARRDDLSPGQLQPAWKRYSEEGNVDILEQPCAFSSSLAHLVRHYKAEISRLKLK